MKLYVVENYNEMSKLAAQILLQRIHERKVNLGMATGSTPVGLYKRLVEEFSEGKVNFEHVCLFNLDEYFPINPNNPQSFFHFMKQHVYGPLQINKSFIPNGLAEDVNAECEAYENLIEYHGGIDVQILGVGRNGHIGFNEPGTSFSSKTHVVELKSETIIDNSRFFEDPKDVPKQAITMGIDTILKAKEILLLASGQLKAEAVRELFFGTISENCPVTALRNHPQVMVIVDRTAASLIQ